MKPIHNPFSIDIILTRIPVRIGKVAPFVILALAALILLINVGPVYAVSASVDLDQCHNGPATAAVNCEGVAWANGNANPSQAHYAESYSVPYRAVMTDLPTNKEITIDIGYDTMHSGKHAIDYLTHYSRLEPHVSTFGHSAETIDPILGVEGLDPVFSTYPIPVPSSAPEAINSFRLLDASETVMTLFGGTITGVASSEDVTKSVISVTFTANSSTAVLAWGGRSAVC